MKWMALRIASLLLPRATSLPSAVSSASSCFPSLTRTARANAFIDKPKLKRAQSVKDKELTIQEVTDNQVKALIRDYHIAIDLRNRLILHDCADWSTVLPSKRFCKHLGKLLLSLDEEKASNILKQIYANKEKWEFKPYTE